MASYSSRARLLDQCYRLKKKVRAKTTLPQHHSHNPQTLPVLRDSHTWPRAKKRHAPLGAKHDTPRANVNTPLYAGFGAGFYNTSYNNNHSNHNKAA